METYCPKNKEEWRNWLRENHLTKESIWLIMHKKNSPTPNLNWSEAVDQALCFGWIDSTVRPIDDIKYKHYYTRRKPKSHWSKINKDKVKVLMEQGLMAEAGLKSIEIAKENGSWSFLDDVEALVLPEDLNDAFSKHKGSKEYYESLSNSVKKQFLFWVKSAKRAETRQKRILEIAECASRGVKPKVFG